MKLHVQSTECVQSQLMAFIRGAGELQISVKQASIFGDCYFYYS